MIKNLKGRLLQLYLKMKKRNQRNIVRVTLLKKKLSQFLAIATISLNSRLLLEKLEGGRLMNSLMRVGAKKVQDYSVLLQA